MPDWNAIAKHLRDAKQAQGRFLGLYAMQCLWEIGLRRLERALAMTSTARLSLDDDSLPGGRN